MPYAHRPIHDAGAHVMETPDWVHEFADSSIRDRIPPLFVNSVGPGEDEMIESLRKKHADPT